jgi:hypothetical protein
MRVRSPTKQRDLGRAGRGGAGDGKKAEVRGTSGFT